MSVFSNNHDDPVESFKHIYTFCCHRDIAELTQQVNRLDNQLNLLIEQNEALREQCGLGSEDAVDEGPLRSRKNAELEQLKKDTCNHTLSLQV